MKKFNYILLVLANLLMFNLANAQKQWCYTNYKIDSIAYNPVVPYNIGTQMTVVRDSFSVVIPIGFNFNFYGHDFSSLLISPNGYLTFDTTQAGRRSKINSASTPLPESSSPRNSIFLLWQDLQPEIHGTIKYTSTGTAPNRMFIVSYDSTRIYSALGSLDTPYVYSTAQVVLYETTNIIEMYILYTVRTKLGGGYFYQGVANSTGLVAMVPKRNPCNPSIAIQNDGKRFTQFNTAYPASTPICMVSVDSATQKNMVIWQKPVGISIDSFIIYRESNAAGVYDSIGVQSYSSFSTFIDMGSNPAQQANRYKLGFLDSCGIVAKQNNAHKTVHLNINQGSGNTWNLIWDAYEGFGFSSFNLYRGTSPNTMILLTTIASTLYSYTDLTPPSGTVYYMIEVVNPNPCSPSRLSANISSFSNIVNGTVTGIPGILNESSISIYPNPVNNVANISFTLNGKSDVAIVISDLSGRMVYSESYPGINNSFEQQIDCSSLSGGVYFLQIKTDTGNYNRKIVIH